MVALAANTPFNSKGSSATQSYPVAASVRIYQGALVMIDSGGYARPAAALLDNKGCVGLAEAEADNSSGSDGDIDITVHEGVFLINAASLVQGTVFSPVWATDDNNVQKDPGALLPFVGIVKRFVSATQAWVEITGPATHAIAGKPFIVAADYTLDLIPNGDLITDWTPGFDGEILAVAAAVRVAGTGAGASIVGHWEVGATRTTGGDLTLTLAVTDTVGKVTAGSAITAANAFKDTDTLSLVFAQGTIFTAGQVTILTRMRSAA